MALPTTPTCRAASTALGKTQKTSMFLTSSLLRRPDDHAGRFEVYFGDVLQGKRDVDGAPRLPVDHQDLVRAGLEGLTHRADDVARVAHGGEPDEVSHVELPLLWSVELGPVEHQLR